MSYVDLIIKYLSGDLSREETKAFEKELESNTELKEAFEAQAAAFELIRDQLQKQDLQAFKDELRKAMSKDAPLPASRKAGLRSWWYIPSAVACSLAILFTVLLKQTGNERVLSRYHHPTKDPVVQAFYQDTRGESESGITAYHQGNYDEAMDLLSVRITRESANKMTLLYYLLSAIELDREKEVLELISLEHSPTESLLDQSVIWYTTMALIKSDRRKAALEKLHPLTEGQGPYQNDAIKLEKVLLK